MLNIQGSISWKIFLFPSHLKGVSVLKKKKEYFGLDLVEEGSERTYWTHKASIWKGLFESVQEMALTGEVDSISDMFNGVLACPVRAVPNGPNDTKTFKSVKGQNIQHWIMLVPMPVDIDSSEYIKEFIHCFQDLCKKLFIRDAYKSGVNAISQHPGMLNQISPDGNYWNVIDNAVENNIIFKSFNCLSEVLQDFTISVVVPLMFGVRRDATAWPDSIKTYASGN